MGTTRITPPTRTPETHRRDGRTREDTPRGGVRVEVASGPGALAELTRRGWDALLMAAPHPDPLRLAGVLALGAPPGVRPQTPRVLTATAGGELVGAAVLGVARERGLVTVRHLGHPSGWLAPEPPAADGTARRALADALIGQAGDLLVLEELPAEGPLARAILRRRPDADVIEGPVTYVADITRDTPALVRRRRDAARAHRRARQAGVPLTVRVATDWCGEIAPVVAELLEFQAHSRAGREMDPLTATREGRALAGRMIGVAGAHGAVRVATVHAGGRLAAFHLAIVGGDHAVGFKTAACRDIAGVTGLGWVSMLALHDHLAGEGVRTVDMGPGGDAHKAPLATPHPLVTARLGLSRLGSAYLAAVRARRAARGWAMRSRVAGGAGAWAAAVAPVAEMV